MRIARFVWIGAALCLTLLAVPATHAVAPVEDQHAQHASNAPAGLVREVRDATRPFLDADQAMGMGYQPYLGCVSGPQEGAMGLHLVKGDLVGDGKIDPAQPEALMYEMRNGRLYLLGVEYIVFAEAWDAANPVPPAMSGQLFTYNTSPNRFGLPPYYALHVWAWRDNPHGTFVDWNPQVSCDGFTENP